MFPRKYFISSPRENSERSERLSSPRETNLFIILLLVLCISIIVGFFVFQKYFLKHKNQVLFTSPTPPAQEKIPIPPESITIDLHQVKGKNYGAFLLENKYTGQDQSENFLYGIDPQGNKDIVLHAISKCCNNFLATVEDENIYISNRHIHHTVQDKNIVLTPSGQDITSQISQKSLQESMLLSRDKRFLITVNTINNTDFEKQEGHITIEDLMTKEKKIVKKENGENFKINFPGASLDGWGADQKILYINNSLCYEGCGTSEIWKIKIPERIIYPLLSINKSGIRSDSLYIFPEQDKAFGVIGTSVKNVNDFLPPHKIVLYDLVNDTSKIIYEGPEGKLIRNIFLSEDGKKLFFNENEFTLTENNFSGGKELTDDLLGKKKNIKIVDLDQNASHEFPSTGDLIGIYPDNNYAVIKSNAYEDGRPYKWFWKDLASGEEKLIAHGFDGGTNQQAEIAKNSGYEILFLKHSQ